LGFALCIGGVVIGLVAVFFAAVIWANQEFQDDQDHWSEHKRLGEGRE
jgi:hypothetical protein